MGWTRRGLLSAFATVPFYGKRRNDKMIPCAEEYKRLYHLPFVPIAAVLAVKEEPAKRDDNGTLWSCKTACGIHFHGPDDQYAFFDSKTGKTEVI